MRIHKIYIALGLMIALSMFLELVAHASETNELTKITFNTPVQLPDRVLPAGTYTFQVAGNGDNPDLVQIFNAEGTALLATFETASAERTRVTSHTSAGCQRTGSPGQVVLSRQFNRTRVHLFQAAGAGDCSRYPGDFRWWSSNAQHTGCW